jgi:hypothetical protein
MRFSAVAGLELTEHVPFSGAHNIVVMAITNAEHVSSHAVTRAGANKVLYAHLVVRIYALPLVSIEIQFRILTVSIVLAQPMLQRLLAESGFKSAAVLLKKAQLARHATKNARKGTFCMPAVVSALSTTSIMPVSLPVSTQ